MATTFFSSARAFRNWLEKNHTTKSELVVGFYKVGSGKPSLTWSQSVDEALCFGWIDGVRKSIDAESYSIRFTPRKPKSIWSTININKVAELEKSGRMREAGRAAFKLRTEAKSGIYSHEKEAVSLNKTFEKQFKSNKQAWHFFSAQAPSYKKVMLHWIMAAKQEKTKLARLEKTIALSALQKRMM